MFRAFASGLVVGLIAASCGQAEAPRCLPSNCIGCCSDEDTCVVDVSEFACGRRGEACFACEAGAACVSGACTDTGMGTGGGDVGAGGGDVGAGGGDSGAGGGDSGAGGGDSGTGGGSTGTGGGSAGTGGGSAGTGGGSAGTGGGSAGTGGGSAGTGGGSAGTGGGSAGTGGGSAGTGGGSAGTGGGSAGTGGGSAGPGRIVINEVDYDNVAGDTEEFIELFNPGTSAFSLADVSLVLINGANGAEYLRLSLQPLTQLGPGEYIVIGSGLVVAALPAGVRSLTFAASQDNVQNGAPDAVAVVSGTSTLLDSVSYEGATTWLLSGASIPLTEGAASGAPADSNTQQGSIGRRPNGVDTNDNAADFAFIDTPTPGGPNP